MTVKRLGPKRENGGETYLQRKADEFKPINHLVYFDSETLPSNNDPDNQEHKSFMSCAIFRKPTESKITWQYEERTYGHGCADLIDDVEAMLTHTSHKVERVSIIGHNMGFDFMVCGFYNELLNRGFEFYPGKSIVSDSSKPFFYVFKRNCECSSCSKEGAKRVHTKTIEFLDSGNYFAQSLAQLGKWFGYPKTEFKFHDDDNALDFNRSRRADRDHDSPEYRECVEYCMNDCHVLREAYEKLEEFMRVNDLGPLRSTIAATALNVYQRKFIPDGVEIRLHNIPELFDLEESSYSGGAVLARRIFAEKETFSGYQVDFVSMYASVMKSELMPVELYWYYNSAIPVHIQKQPTQDEILKHFSAGRTAIARVQLNIPEGFGNARFPMRTDSALIFPVGEFTTTLAGPELKLAIERGFVVKVEETAIYHTAVIFDEYVAFFGSKKIEYAHAGNKAFEALAKLFNNSLYGKWAQTVERFITATDTDDEVILDVIAEAEEYFSENPEETYYPLQGDDGEEYKTKRLFGGEVMVSTNTRDASRHTNMAIAAHITAHARTRLFDVGDIAGWNDIIYCDTDSWMVTNEGAQRLEDAGCIGEDFGKLSYEMELVSIQVQGLKHYSIDGYEWDKKTQDFDRSKIKAKTRHKGISIKTDDDGNVINRTADGNYVQYRFERIHPAAIRGKKAGVTVSKIIKKGSAATYQKGTIGETGWVDPYNLSQ